MRTFFQGGLGLLWGLIALGWMAGAQAAETVSKPHTFSNGTPANANHVNANFDALYSKFNQVLATLETLNQRAAQVQLHLAGGIATTTSLIAYYPFNGNANDASGNGLHGTITGSLPAVADRFGRPNSAYSFSNQGFISLGSSESLRMTEEWTITLWLLQTTSRGAMVPVSRREGPCGTSSIANNYELLIANNAQLRVDMLGNGNAPNWDVPLRLYEWAFVAVSAKKATQKATIYVNQHRREVSIPIEAAHVSGSLTGLGRAVCDFDASNYIFYGYLDDVRFYNRALSEAEIVTISQAKL